jgi:ubiquinone/menaquinone biosynthesis C-methylase UbiE
VAIRDKTGALRRLSEAKLDLGCGPRKRAPDYIGIDLLDYEDVDIVGDAADILRQMPNDTVEHIYSSHFLEHVDDVERLLAELARVLRPGGTLELIVPHFSNPYFWSDLTHKHGFGLYSLAYFASETPFKRKVPTYGRNLGFRLDQVTLHFKSPRPFYGRYALKRTLGAFFNLTRATREFYEENLAYILPCYEIKYLLTKDPVEPTDPGHQA